MRISRFLERNYCEKTLNNVLCALVSVYQISAWLLKLADSRLPQILLQITNLVQMANQLNSTTVLWSWADLLCKNMLTFVSGLRRQRRTSGSQNMYREIVHKSWGLSAIFQLRGAASIQVRLLFEGSFNATFWVCKTWTCKMKVKPDFADATKLFQMQTNTLASEKR